MKAILNIKIESLEKIAKDYKKFINNCTSFSLVLRDGVELNSQGTNFVNSLTPYLITIELKSEWPGTILTSNKATIYYYRLTLDSLKKLDHLNSLFDLKAPSFLEDICFHRNNDPFLITISHEKDLYFEINEDEIPDLKKSLEEEGIECEN